MDNAIMDLVRETLRTLGQGILSDLIQVEWNRSFTGKMGDARWRPTPRIRLSAPLWPLASEAERRETVIHEVCHVVDFFLSSVPGTSYKRDGIHGRSWKALMAKCGAEGSRCHNVKRPPEMRRRQARVEMKCGCTMAWSFTSHRLARMTRGRKYSCPHCKQPIVRKQLSMNNPAEKTVRVAP